eukprot:g1642.t1
MATNTESNPGRAAVTMVPALSRTGIKFWSSQSDLNEWLQYDGDSSSLLDCNADGTDISCRDTVLTKYFRFVGSNEGDTFPRVEMITSVNVSSMSIVVSSTTDNGGPLVMSFLYNATNSSDDCNWTPYQVVAWIVPVDPQISGMIRGGLDEADENVWSTSYVIVDVSTQTSGTRVRGSPNGNWISTASTRITIGGSNFAAVPSKNTIAISNVQEFETAISNGLPRRICSTESETWSPDTATIEATCVDADDEGRWIILNISKIAPLNGGIPIVALLSSGGTFVYDDMIDTVRVNVNGSLSQNVFTALGDIDFDTNVDFNRSGSEKSDWILGVLMATSFELRSVRVAAAPGTSANQVPEGTWLVQGGDGSCDSSSSSTEITCSSWTTILNLTSNQWEQNVTDCASWAVAASIDEALRDYYEAYRIMVPNASASCCSIAELELGGVDFSSWLQMQVSVDATSAVFTSDTVKYVTDVQAIETAVDDASNVNQIEITIDQTATSAITLTGSSFDNLGAGSVNRFEMHLLQAITVPLCCGLYGLLDQNDDLKTMQNRIAKLGRYINGTERNTVESDMLCNTTSQDIVSCYIGMQNDSWSRSLSDATICPCNLQILNSSNSPQTSSGGDALVQLNPRWSETQSLEISETLYGFIRVQGTTRYTDVVPVGIVEGEPFIFPSEQSIATNAAYITVSGDLFSKTASLNSISFRCATGFSVETCNLNGYGCSVPVLGTVESVVTTSTATQLVVRITQMSYLSGCNSTTGVALEAQVGVVGIDGASDWEKIGNLISTQVELSITEATVVRSYDTKLTILGSGFAAELLDSPVVAAESNGTTFNVTTSYILTLSQGSGVPSTTDQGDDTILPEIIAPLVANTRTSLVLSFIALSARNQDSYLSGDVDVSFTEILNLTNEDGTSVIETYTFTSTDVFAVVAEPAAISEWITDAGTCGLNSNTELFTIRGSGFDPAITSVTFDSPIRFVQTSVTHTTIVLSFTELNASSYGNVSAIVYQSSTKCWNETCTGPFSSVSCDLASGFSYENKLWYGCSEIGSIASDGACINTDGNQIACAASCSESCTSPETNVALVYPSPPTITANTSSKISCTANEVTIRGRGFDYAVPANNIVRLTLNDVENADSFACTVTSSSFYSVKCVFTHLNCSAISVNDTLKASVALSIETTDDDYACFDSSGALLDSQGQSCEFYDLNSSQCGAHDTADFSSSSVCCSCGGGCSSFSSNMTAYSESVEIASFRETQVTIVQSDSTIRSSTSNLTIFGYEFDIRDVSNNVVIFRLNHSDDVPTGTVVFAGRTNDEDASQNYGYIVVNFYKLGPSNVVNASDRGLEATVSAPCSDCLALESFVIVAAVVEAATIELQTSNVGITTLSNSLTVEGLGFDPYVASRNIVTFTTNGDACAVLKGTVTESTMTHISVDLHTVSTANIGDVFVVANVSGINISNGIGAELGDSSPPVAVAQLTLATPTLAEESYTVPLSSDSLLLTISGYGFDNGARNEFISDDRPFYGNSVNFTAAQEGPVMSHPSLPSATRSTLVVSFTKLNARHVGNLSASVRLHPYNCSAYSEIASPFSDSSVVASIFPSSPTVDVNTDSFPSIDNADANGILTYTIKGRGFDSTPEYNSIRHITYIRDDDVEEWSPFGATPLDASRTHLVMSLGPTVTILNAGPVKAQISVAEYNATENSIVPACPTPWSQPGCGENSSNLYSADLVEVTEITKGTPTITRSNQTIPSDGTCLYIVGNNFQATGGSLTTNPCSGADTCNNVTDEDLRLLTNECTTSCGDVYLAYRDYQSGDYPSLLAEQTCSSWMYTSNFVDLGEIETSLDVMDISFDVANNTGYSHPLGKILYSSKNDVCIYVSRLAPQNKGDLYLTVQLSRYKLTALNTSSGDFGGCDYFEGDMSDVTFEATAPQMVGVVEPSVPTVLDSNESFSINSNFVTVRGTGFDKGNQTLNTITFFDSNKRAGVVSNWENATRTRMRFEFFQLPSAGWLNGSVSVAVDVGDTQIVTSNNATIGFATADDPIIDSDDFVLTSGVNVTLTIRGSGFYPSADFVDIYLDDGVGGCYTTEDECANFTDGVTAPIATTYDVSIVRATRTMLALTFPELYRNSTSFNASSRPLAVNLSIPTGSAQQSPVALLNLELFCSHENINSTCADHGSCFDITTAPITELPYVCECVYPYGGHLCETNMTLDELKCYNFCVEESSSCVSAYKNAATGTNALGQTMTVSLSNYAAEYLLADNASTRSDQMYSRMTDADVNAFYQCWTLALAENITNGDPTFYGEARSVVVDYAQGIFGYFDSKFFTQFLFVGAAFYILLAACDAPLRAIDAI